MSATWSDIKHLSEKLKLTQSQPSKVKIPERTWVDIIKNVKAKGLLNIYHTLDGSHLITEDELCTEIRNEIEGNNGRISVDELSSELSVDGDLIINLLPKVSESEKIHEVYGDLISKTYLQKVKLEVFDRFHENGFLSLDDVCRNYNLPMSLIESFIDFRGKRFKSFDKVYYSEEYLAICKAKLIGFLSSIITPTSLNDIVNSTCIPEKLLMNLLDNLISKGTITGNLSSNKQSFTPNCYLLSRSNYVKNFVTQNGFIESDTLKRLGISDFKSFLRQNFSHLRTFSNIAVDESLLEEIASNIHEYMQNSSFVETTECIPISLVNCDISEIISHCLKDSSVSITNDLSYLYANQLPMDCIKSLDTVLKSEAESIVTELRKVQSGKGSNISEKSTNQSVKQSKNLSIGGTGGREIKTKVTKKKYLQNKRSENEEEEEIDNGHWKYVDDDKLRKELLKDESLGLCDELAVVMFEMIFPELQMKLNSYVETLKEVKTASLCSKSDVAEMASTLNKMLHSLYLLEQGIVSIDGNHEGLKDQLMRHLMRGHAMNVFNQVLVALSIYYDVSFHDDQQITSPKATSAKTTNPPKKTRGKKNKKKKDDWSDDDDQISAKEDGLEIKEEIVDDNYVKIDSETVKPVTKEPPKPEDITPEMRTKFIQKVGGLNLPERDRLVSSLTSMHASLKQAQSNSNHLPVERFIGELEFPTITCMGMHVPLVIRFTGVSKCAQQDPKRRKEDHSKAVELAIQMETQLSDLSEQIDASLCAAELWPMCATAAQLGVCVLLQSLLDGYPMSTPGKLVPDLAKYVAQLVRGEAREVNPKVKNLLLDSSCNTPDTLVKLTDHIVAMVKGEDDAQLLTESREAVAHLAKVVQACRKLIK